MKQNEFVPTRRSWPKTRLGLRSFTLASMAVWLLANGMAVAEEPLAPILTGFSPLTGMAGTEVTIEGENFAGATQVLFNGISATFHEGFSETSLVATVPVGATSGPITVVTPLGSGTTELSFTVTAAGLPEITDFSPQSGPVDTPVVINGSHFVEVLGVEFAGIPAVFTLFGGTITTSVPEGATSGSISVVTAAGTATSAAPFTVTIPGLPMITSVVPSRASPGARITVSGQNLEFVTGVSFNGVAASFEHFGATLLATVPETATTGLITVVSSKGSGHSPELFVVLNPLSPEITRFTPETGDVGTVVTITGTNLLGATEVRMGGVLAEFTSVSSSQLEAHVPAGATTGRIAVTTPAGTAVSAERFYLPAKVLSFAPSHGLVGMEVIIQGINFTDALAVLFGEISATFTVVSDGQIRTTVPEGARSGVISIATPSGFTRIDGNFLLPPAFSSFEPISGPVQSDVVIIGENLLGATSVRFGGVEASFVPFSATTLVATVPTAASDGPITVTTPAGSTGSSESFFVGLFSDLAVGLSAFPDEVNVGDFLTYSITVTNRGPLEAATVVLTEQLPPGIRLIFAPSGAECVEQANLITCQLGTLPPGGSLTVRVSAEVIDGPHLTNQVMVASTSGDPNLNNNAASVVTLFQGVPPPPPPPLTNVTLVVSATAGALELSWPAAAEGFLLETASALPPSGAWTVAPESPATISDRRIVTQPTASGTRFYRLRKP